MELKALITFAESKTEQVVFETVDAQELFEGIEFPEGSLHYQPLTVSDKIIIADEEYIIKEIQIELLKPESDMRNYNSHTIIWLNKADN